MISGIPNMKSNEMLFPVEESIVRNNNYFFKNQSERKRLGESIHTIWSQLVSLEQRAWNQPLY